MDVRGVRVLLVGNAPRKASVLEDYLLKWGCDICFGTSQKDALELLKPHRFDLVLSEFIPKSKILEAAEAWHADLIVLGSHGRKGLGRFLIGGISNTVARHAHCSAEIVRIRPVH